MNKVLRMKGLVDDESNASNETILFSGNEEEEIGRDCIMDTGYKVVNRVKGVKIIDNA